MSLKGHFAAMAGYYSGAAASAAFLVHQFAGTPVAPVVPVAAAAFLLAATGAAAGHAQWREITRKVFAPFADLS